MQCGSVPQSQTNADVSSPLISVRTNGKYGYIDKTGRFEIPPKFIVAEDFIGDRAIVRTEKGYGVIDKQGNYIIPPQSEYSIEQYEGAKMFVAIESDCRYKGYISAIGVIDYNGNWVLNPIPCESYRTLGDGILIYEVPINDDHILEFRLLRGVIKDGHIIHTPIFKYGNTTFKIQDGLTTVQYGDKIGYIDTTGKIAINPAFDCAYEFSEGLAVAKYKWEWYLIDKAGDTITKLPSFQKISRFSEGLLAVQSQKKWGYVNKTGKVVIPFEYDEAEDFQEGLAAVEKDGKCGFINKKGKVVIPLQYPAVVNRYKAGVGNFEDGVARVSGNDGKYGVINKSGKIIADTKYDRIDIDKDYNGIIIVKLNKNYGLIDKSGKVLVSPKYNGIRIWKGVIFAKDNQSGLYGIIDKTGNWIVLPQFD